MTGHRYNEDGEVRELTAEDFKRTRPIAETDPGMVEVMQAMRNRGGRPKVETPKVHVGFRIAAEIVDGIKVTGKGYNARMEMVLRDALAKGLLGQAVQQSKSADVGKPKK